VKAWIEGRRVIEQFARSLDSKRSFPEASEYELEVHAVQVARITDLLRQASESPRDKRPPAKEWDELLGPLLYQLFAKGDDIDRYILAGIWRQVLLEAGEIDGFLRACTAVAGSARNFYRLEEALEVCREGREAAKGLQSAALANLINMEGIVQVYRGDYEASERSFREASILVEGLPEEDFPKWTRVTKSAYRNRLRLNTMETYLRRGISTTGEERAKFAGLARECISRLEHEPLSDDHRNFLLVNTAVLAIVEGRLKFAKSLLSPMARSGPGEIPANLPFLAVHARLLSVIATLEGHWDAAYQWIRKALREGIRYGRIGEEQDVLEQALDVLAGLKDNRENASHGVLVEDMVCLLEDKDWYTGRSHSRGVSSLSVRLGEILKATTGRHLELKTLEVAGLLHDIGKLRTPWSLLNKLAPLGPKEWDILKEHPLHGAQILERIGMKDLAPVVRGHHEHMDGSGYPDGRPPDLMAAIVGVSDVFEAATNSTRRYKMPKSRFALFQELSASSGRRYHPDVVGALKKLLEHDGAP
jgi:HD-GYP domain-containing protein (c-di-GMP phosphodiesterase class II)